MPKLPPSQVQRQSTLNASMTPNAAKGRTNVVAPEPRPLAPLGTVASGFQNPYLGAITIQDPSDPTSQIILEPTTSAYIEIMSSDGGDVFFNPYGGVSFGMTNADGSGFTGLWSGGIVDFKVTDIDGNVIFRLYQPSGGSPKLGLFGHSPNSQQTVTGSRGGNAALASLLSALDAYGLIVDSTSA